MKSSTTFKILKMSNENIFGTVKVRKSAEKSFENIHFFLKPKKFQLLSMKEKVEKISDCYKHVSLLSKNSFKQKYFIKNFLFKKEFYQKNGLQNLSDLLEGKNIKYHKFHKISKEYMEKFRENIGVQLQKLSLYQNLNSEEKFIINPFKPKENQLTEKLVEKYFYKLKEKLTKISNNLSLKYEFIVKSTSELESIELRSSNFLSDSIFEIMLKIIYSDIEKYNVLFKTKIEEFLVIDLDEFEEVKENILDIIKVVKKTIQKSLKKIEFYSILKDSDSADFLNINQNNQLNLLILSYYVYSLENLFNRSEMKAFFNITSQALFEFCFEKRNLIDFCLKWRDVNQHMNRCILFEEVDDKVVIKQYEWKKDPIIKMSRNFLDPRMLSLKCEIYQNDYPVLKRFFFKNCINHYYTFNFQRNILFVEFKVNVLKDFDDKKNEMKEIELKEDCKKKVISDSVFQAYDAEGDPVCASEGSDMKEMNLVDFHQNLPDMVTVSSTISETVSHLTQKREIARLEGLKNQEIIENKGKVEMSEISFYEENEKTEKSEEEIFEEKKIYCYSQKFNFKHNKKKPKFRVKIICKIDISTRENHLKFLPSPTYQIGAAQNLEKNFNKWLTENKENYEVYTIKIFPPKVEQGEFIFDHYSAVYEKFIWRLENFSSKKNFHDFKFILKKSKTSFITKSELGFEKFESIRTRVPLLSPKNVKVKIRSNRKYIEETGGRKFTVLSQALVDYQALYFRKLYYFNFRENCEDLNYVIQDFTSKFSDLPFSSDFSVIDEKTFCIWDYVQTKTFFTKKHRFCMLMANFYSIFDDKVERVVMFFNDVVKELRIKFISQVKIIKGLVILMAGCRENERTVMKILIFELQGREELTLNFHYFSRNELLYELVYNFEKNMNEEINSAFNFDMEEEWVVKDIRKNNEKRVSTLISIEGNMSFLTNWARDDELVIFVSGVCVKEEFEIIYLKKNLKWRKIDLKIIQIIQGLDDMELEFDLEGVEEDRVKREISLLLRDKENLEFFVENEEKTGFQDSKENVYFCDFNF